MLYIYYIILYHIIYIYIYIYTYINIHLMTRLQILRNLRFTLGFDIPTLINHC